ncbi:Alpha-(1,3)-fucosyltransferase fut-6 [Caenorhabditis elegans]|uniref:Alpha-(1,3)-fucosyltransferase fut-6 n=1 Tax=Caenorhabditis elegans TaxID=6239 RepID=FUTE_CAEEL|nr:Alpha-(1,3)-fucosyltransferase fut-6 [Caenorhabditis elegans]G5EEE1.1 RecName: Full=Alpha-(1,3)-fucosyltransferase fut-6 [Caenorhabditis elegans]CAG32980.1 alpha1,3-fucosyltransferase [Caenorhabditis elegans]CCD69223.1 Alpha-(1,3)-fucosyltransferase fut-6 [Caenorhabditis elegans]|eukprot:NP_494823.2 Alpha-(1,3)-fucosyltransferase fut-6 [Caenorhabditis elegans]
MSQIGGATCTWRYLGRFVTLGIYASVALFVWYTLVPTRSKHKDSIAINNNNADPATALIPVHTKNVVIYAATKFFGHPITTERFLATCPDVQNYCRITQEESEFDNADAVLFHNADYRGSTDKFKKMKSQRKPGVPYVLWSLESPTNDMFRPDSHMINWTMTYRTDSDVWAPYGTIVKLKNPVEVDLNAIWEGKTKTATWLASNCITQNHRFDLIKKIIDNGFEIDIWGNCGKQVSQCAGVDNQESPCVLELIKPYKFYISMENSNCKDYVTEKFWKALNDRMTIPIVLARKYYKDLGVPDSAYIAVDDYATLDEFLAHVKKVNKEKDLFLSYHQWRKEWKVIIGSGFSGWCTLCNKLQDKDYILKNPKSYKDVAWWHSFEMCNNQIASKYL